MRICFENNLSIIVRQFWGKEIYAYNPDKDLTKFYFYLYPFYLPLFSEENKDSKELDYKF